MAIGWFLNRCRHTSHRTGDRSSPRNDRCPLRIDWAQALVRLHRLYLDPQVVADTIGCFLKDRHDIEDLDRAQIGAMVEEARSTGA